jgi:hypothetical protein
LLAVHTAYYCKRYNSSQLEHFQPKTVTWPEEFITSYFVSINATDFGYWTHSLNTYQDDYTTRVPAVAYFQYKKIRTTRTSTKRIINLCTNIIKVYWAMINFVLLIFKGKTY